MAIQKIIFDADFSVNHQIQNCYQWIALNFFCFLNKNWILKISIANLMFKSGRAVEGLFEELIVQVLKLGQYQLYLGNSSETTLSKSSIISSCLKKMVPMEQVVRS